MNLREGWGLVGLFGLLTAGAVALWRGVPAAPAPSPERADTGPFMDLDHLNPRDVSFLAQTLRTGPVEARRSAAMALVDASDARGAALLFEVAALQDNPAAYCAAALEIARMQQLVDAVELLMAALASPAAAPCHTDARERLEGLTRDPRFAEALVASDRSEVRLLAVRQLSASGGDGVTALLEAAVNDANPDVRYAALAFWAEPDTPQLPEPALQRAEAQETDPEMVALVAAIRAKAMAPP